MTEKPRLFEVKPITIAEKKYPKHRYENTPQHPFSMAMIGTRGSGKSTILYNLLTDAYKKYFHRVVIITPNLFQDNLYVKLHNDDLLDLEDMHTSYDENILTGLMETQDRIKEMIDQVVTDNKKLEPSDRIKVPKLPRVLIVIDDSGPELRESIPLKKVYTTGRHKNISIIVMVQKYTNLNVTCRSNLNDLIITRPSTMKEIKTISEDKAIPNLEQFILKMNAENSYNFCWVDRQDKPHLKFGPVVQTIT